MKFFQWNVHYSNSNTRKIAEIVAPNNPDIIGLNEFIANGQDQVRHLNEMSPGRDYAMQPGWSNFDGYGTYIFYDKNTFDAVEGGVRSVYCSGTQGGNRAANWVVLREKSTQKLLITGGIHLSYCSNGCDWVHECELGQMYDKFNEMKGKHAGARVVWMGDMNRGSRDLIIRNLKTGKIGGRDVFQIEDLGLTDTLTYYRGGIIDFIFGETSAFNRVDGGSTGQGTRYQWLNGADHFPIFATVGWAN